MIKVENGKVEICGEYNRIIEEAGSVLLSIVDITSKKFGMPPKVALYKTFELLCDAGISIASSNQAESKGDETDDTD